MSDDAETKALHEAMLEAESAPDVLRTLTRAIWHNDDNGAFPDDGDAIPDVDQINALRPDEATIGECNERMEQAWRAVPAAFGPWVVVPLSGAPWVVSIHSLIRQHLPETLPEPSGGGLGAKGKVDLRWTAAAAMDSANGGPEVRAVQPDRVIQAIHDLWKTTYTPPCPFCSDLVQALPDCGVCGGTRYGA